MWLISYAAQPRKKMSFREVTWKKILLRLPVSKGQITPHLLSGVKCAGLWPIFAQGQVSDSPGRTTTSSAPASTHTHGASMDQHSQHLYSAAPQPDPTGNTSFDLTFVKHISWCDARAFTRYQTQLTIQGKFFGSFPLLQKMSLRFYLCMSSCWSNFPVELCLFTPWWFLKKISS